MGTNGGISALVKGEEKASSGKEKREVERRGGKEDPALGRGSQAPKLRSRDEICLTSVTMAGGGRGGCPHGCMWEGQLGVPREAIGGEEGRG